MVAATSADAREGFLLAEKRGEVPLPRGITLALALIADNAEFRTAGPQQDQAGYDPAGHTVGSPRSGALDEDPPVRRRPLAAVGGVADR